MIKGNWMDNILRCEYCRKTMRRDDSLVVVDRGDGYREKRLCRDCQVKFYLNEARRVGLRGEGGAKLRLFTKNLEEGK